VVGAVRMVAGLLVAVLAVMPVAACGGTEEGRSLPDVVRDAVEQARERVREATGEIGSRGNEQRTPIRNDTKTAFEYEEYERLVGQVIGSLETYWARTMPAELGAPYPANPSGYFYYRPEEKPGPSCGGERAPPRNAFYCPAGDFIAWDEPGLLIPYYIRGDFAAAYVLAHEFGHAIQARLPEDRQLQVTILRELQADCLAGAWTRWVEEQKLLQAGDLDEAVAGIYTGRDVPGTAFTDPRAHGSGFQRIRAFGDGYEGGPRECLRPDWVVDG
jgi:uncharacterized protein